MTRIKQKDFEKVFTDLLIGCINEKESKNISFLRYGNEGTETDLVYKDDGDTVGIEVFGHYQSVKKGNKFTLLKLTNRIYSKGSDAYEFLRSLIEEKISKSYQPSRKWLLCVNRFISMSPDDFYQIFLLNYHNGWGNFERVFTIFEKYASQISKYDTLKIFMRKLKSRLYLLLILL